MGRYIVGMDAGGTNLRLRWRELASGSEQQLSCPSDPEGGPEPALELLRALPVGLSDVEAVVAGITKVSRGETKTSWERALGAACPQARVTVVPDFVVAFHGAVPEGVGLLCIAGTGSVVYGENEDGRSLRVGGRGWEYGDEGSGAFVTTELMRRTLRACDGLWEHRALTLAVCDSLGTHEAGLLGERARQEALRSGRGFLVKLVIEQALAGDTEASDLLAGTASWLARSVRAAYEPLGFSREQPAHVALVGGMWEQAGAWMREPFARLLRRWELALVPTDPMGTPVEGALRLAERSCL